MGRRGPKAIPTRILKIRGSRRARGRKDDVPASGQPIRPVWLVGEAKRKWDMLAPQLGDMGLLAACDRDLLALYCETYNEYLAARKMTKKAKSFLIKTPSGRIARNPLLLIRDDAAERLRKLASEFGMSPSSRSGLTINRQKRETEKKRFFNRS